jgi:hypothetical protein
VKLVSDIANIWSKETWNDWRLENLNNEELHNLYTSPDIIIIIKPRRKKWGGHVARMEKIYIYIYDVVKREIEWGDIWLRIGTSGGLL